MELTDPHGRSWTRREIAAAMMLCGTDLVVPVRGALPAPVLNAWRALVLSHPGLLEEVRRHLDAEVAARIRARVEENRRS